MPAPAPALVLGLAAQLFASGSYTRTDADRGGRFDLDRAEVGVEPAWGQRAGAELRLETIRSADPQSAIGIDGNSLVVRAKRAWLWGRWHPGPVTLEARAGLVPEPWIEAVESGYELRALSPTVAEQAGLIDTSDLGVAAVADWTRLRLTVMVGNGEGRTELEQNKGKNTSVALTVRAAELDGAHLAVHLYGRDGSVGVGSTRAHRAGAAVTVSGALHGGGLEGMRAWGVGSRTDLTAWAVAGWATTTLWRRGALGAAARVGWVRSDGETITTTVGIWHDLVPEVRVYLAGEIDRARDGGAVLPGDPAATDATRVMLIVAGNGRMEVR